MKKAEVVLVGARLSELVAAELLKAERRSIRLIEASDPLPIKDTHRDELPVSQLKLRERTFRCGDFLLNGPINAALKSGRLAAEAILST